jgi:hypothetical protein
MDNLGGAIMRPLPAASGIRRRGHVNGPDNGPSNGPTDYPTDYPTDEGFAWPDLDQHWPSRKDRMQLSDFPGPVAGTFTLSMAPMADCHPG